MHVYATDSGLRAQDLGLILVLLLFCSFGAVAQTRLQLHIPDSLTADFYEGVKSFRVLPDRTREQPVFVTRDSVALQTLCQDLLEHFREKSYLAVSLDEVRKADSVLYATFYLGPAMRWIRLEPADDAETLRWLEAAGFREKLFTNAPLYYDALLALERELLVQAENNGYPFARIWLDSIEVQANGGVQALLRLDRNRFFSIKTVKINGDLKLPAAFLPNYLGIKPGEPYSRAKVLRLRDQLRSLLFVEATGNPSVTFAGNEATLQLYLQKKRASRFDFIIGLLPRADATDSRVLITGSLNAAFQNALNLGERFSIELERLRPETQRLDVQAGMPYLFGTPFGVEGRLNIFRRDSTWVDAQSELGVQYLFTGGDYIKIFWENRGSSLQKIDTASILLSRRLPPNLDLRQNGFGMETGLNRLDYRFNPRRGWAVTLKAVAGFNTVLRNNQIEALRDLEEPDFRFSTLYDTLTRQSPRFRLESKLEYYIPFFARSTLKLGIRGGGIFSSRPVYANEQYRIGGNKIQRGFDEESLFATRYVVGTAEFRLLLDLNSYLAVFTDYGYLENETDRQRLFLRPLGVGAGLNFETQAGIFGISVAVGRRDTGQAVDFRAAKFHLGYVSLF
ncbi:MAG: BamA/TamA family outer membrane protein [Bacteroidetes bacterium]|nr:BamA/TamA family outer membrane protein [Bacteroidota bacterium]